MSESRPDWYERMKTGPFRERTFTEEKRRRISELANHDRKRPGLRGWHWAAGAAAAVLLVLFVSLRQPSWFGDDPVVSVPNPVPSEAQPTPSESPQSKVKYVKGETGAYAEPDSFTMHEPEFLVEPGVPVEVKESAGGFARVEQAGRAGWVNEWYLTSDGEERSVVAVEPYLMLVGKPVAFRFNPHEPEPSGFELASGKVVRVTKEYEDWVCIDMITYDQPYGGEFWVKKTELDAWNPTLAKEGVLRQGAIVLGEDGGKIELSAFNPIVVQEKREDGRYRIGAAGGFAGYIEESDFVPNPFLAESEARRLLSSAMQERWLLTAEEMEQYGQFAANHDEELLRGLSPIQIFRYYVQAQEAGDHETAYALFIDDPDHGVPSYESYKNDLSRDQQGVERTWQLWAKLKQGYTLKEEVELTEEDHALIRISPVGGGTSEEVYGFQIVRNDAGIWKVGWMPMQ
ncbi:hypothetical protein RB620_05140 [Paenibacillus sp. LHD-117]|uniref:hypothetical protein n=1 Tax=Paenibacillus sp. LHD-117 TaxID=3071412 RepID=UPI0027E0219C|nr:hypothetical protein [Paenibacillus sp. LHD-117]MDQ6418820.1 hypothetical protein [Paenibacillus sp. LHD-117]